MTKTESLINFILADLLVTRDEGHFLFPRRPGPRKLEAREAGIVLITIQEIHFIIQKTMEMPKHIF